MNNETQTDGWITIDVMTEAWENDNEWETAEENERKVITMNVYPKRSECPDCGGTNNAAMCVIGKCLEFEVHDTCDPECVAPKSELYFESSE